MEDNSQNQGLKILKVSIFLVLLCYFINFVLLGGLVGPWDFDHLSSYYELAWRFWQSGNSLLPQFNPYFCGGRTLGGDPQVPIFHPLTLLVPILGPTRVIKWEMFGQLILGLYGLVGMFKFFRVSREGLLWGTLLYLAGGGMVAKFMVGHVTLGYYFLYPLFLFFSYRLVIEDRSQRPKTLSLYWILFIYCGLYKPNFLIYGVPPLFLEALVRSFLKRDFHILVWFVIGVSFTGLIGAVMYLPSWKYFSDFPRPDDMASKYVPLYAFFANLLFPLKAVPEKLYGPVFLQRHEYNLFLGPIALFFSALGWRKFPVALKAEGISLGVFAFLSIWIGLGAPDMSASPIFAFSWFREFWPGFASIRVPVRFWYSAFLVLILLSAFGFQLPKSKWGKTLLFLFGVLPLLANASINLFKTSVNSRAIIQVHSSVEREYPNEPTWETGSPDTMLGYIRRGVGVLECADNIEVHKVKDLTQGPLLSATHVSNIELRGFWESWHRIRINATGKSGFLLPLNLNHSPYWSYEGNDAQLVSTLGQRLTLKAKNSGISGILMFKQPLVKMGASISLIALLVFLIMIAILFKSNAK